MKIFLYVGNRILCDGLKRILSEALPGNILADQYSSPISDPDVVLFDAEREAERIKDAFPEAKYICLDLGLNDCEIACLAFYHGIHGIISPRLDIQMFCKAILAVHGGELWFNQDYLKRAIPQQPHVPDFRKYRILSDQDRKIICLLAEGQKNHDIADTLCLSESTVKAHVSRIYKTLNVTNRAQLTRLATLNNWLTNS